LKRCYIVEKKGPFVAKSSRGFAIGLSNRKRPRGREGVFERETRRGSFPESLRRHLWYDQSKPRITHVSKGRTERDGGNISPRDRGGEEGENSPGCPKRKEATTNLRMVSQRRDGIVVITPGVRERGQRGRGEK